MFRFTIRDLLWLTLVVALVIGYWFERIKANAAASKMSQAQKRTEFYMDIVVRMQKENYRLSSENDRLTDRLLSKRLKAATRSSADNSLPLDARTLEDLLPKYPPLPGELPSP